MKAKEDFPEIYKNTWHGAYPSGPAAAAAWELPALRLSRPADPGRR